jgi:hypothetical protein
MHICKDVIHYVREGELVATWDAVNGVPTNHKKDMLPFLPAL